MGGNAPFVKVLSTRKLGSVSPLTEARRRTAISLFALQKPLAPSSCHAKNTSNVKAGGKNKTHGGPAAVS